MTSQEKLIEVCKILNCNYENKIDWSFTLKFDKGGLWTRMHERETHFEFSCCVPRSHLVYSKDKPSKIKVSKAKTPEQIAKDLSRRMLPSFNEYADKINEALARHDEWTGKRKNLLHEVCIVFYGEAKNITDECSEKTGYCNEHYVRIRASENTVNLNVDGLSLEQVKKIVEVIK